MTLATGVVILEDDLLSNKTSIQTFSQNLFYKLDSLCCSKPFNCVWSFTIDFSNNLSNRDVNRIAKVEVALTPKFKLVFAFTSAFGQKDRGVPLKRAVKTLFNSNKDTVA